MELKVILYLTAGVAYFVYKQFQKLQKEAISRQAKLESTTVAPNSNDSKSVESMKELFGKNVQDQKKPYLASDENGKGNKTRVFKAHETRNSSYLSSTIVDKEQAHLNAIENNESIGSNAYDTGYLQVRNMILFSELLKRPSY